MCHYLFSVLAFIFLVLIVQVYTTGCKTGGCSNYGAYREVCSSTSQQCQLFCADDQEIKIFSAAFKVFHQLNSCHHTCSPIASSVWNDWCVNKSTCNIDDSWMNASTLPGSQYGGSKHLLLIFSCIQDWFVNGPTPTTESIQNHPTEVDVEDHRSTSPNTNRQVTTSKQPETIKVNGEYSTADPASFITGFDNFPDSLVGNTTHTSAPTGSLTIGDTSSDTDSQKQNDDDKSLGQDSLGYVGFKGGEIAGIVIGTLVCVGGLVLLVVLILLRQRRLSKRPNDAYENHDMINNTGVVYENVQENHAQSLTSEHTPNNDNNAQSNYTELMAHNSSQALSIYTELTPPHRNEAQTVNQQ